MSAPITAEEWRRLREEALHTDLPADLVARGLPAVLLPYQSRIVAAAERNRVTIVPKSRRIGATWGVGALGVLTAGAKKSAGGMDVMYIGYNLDMAREFVDVCAMWARQFLRIAVEVNEFLFRDQDDKKAERDIAAFRIQFASGFEIVALASRPRSLRGRQGFVIIDEAAFHDDLPELLKAALALLIWGGRVLLISTHDGAENPFAALIEEVRKGKKPYGLVECYFDDALRDGLYRRICLVKGWTWTPAAEAQWRDEIRAFYGEGAEEELDGIPRASGGKYLPLHLIHARRDETIPVLRWRRDDRFVHFPLATRTAEAAEWCRETLDPLLSGLDPERRHVFGMDFARSGDLTVIWPQTILADTRRRAPFLIELRNVPFAQQREILWHVLERLPRFCGGAMDARGNGQQLAEETADRFGRERIEMVMLTEGWYREHMPPMKAAFEDGELSIPADDDVVQDFRAIELLRGVPRVVERVDTARGEDKDKSGGKRHGDAAIACALAEYAAGRGVEETFDFHPVPRRGGGRVDGRASREAMPGAGLLGAISRTVKGLFGDDDDD